MKNLITNKSIAIIGNSESLFTKTQGAEIDSHDVVCRINRGIQLINPVCQGVKTDIWAYGSYKQVEDLYDLQLCSNTIHLTHLHRKIKIKGYKKKQNFYFEKTKFYIPMEVLTELEKKSTIKRPSSGLILLYYVCTCFPKSISLYGFDWKETPTWYYQEFTTPHDWMKEKMFVTKNLLNKNHINLK